MGLTPTKACAPAGFCIDPPVSVPSPSTAKLALTAVAVPPLDPPGALVTSYALRVVPLTELLVRVPSPAKSGKFVLPRIMAPASSNLSTTAASSPGIMSTPPVAALNPEKPAVVTKPSWSMLSFITIGTPCKALRIFPALRSASNFDAMSMTLGFIEINELQVFS